MKELLLALLAMIGLTMSSACSAGDERFLAGEWRLEGWMENEGQGQRIEPQLHSARVTDHLASMEPRLVAFTEFYRGANPANVTFSNGVISGFIDHPGQAPFGAHRQEVTGWYREDAFEMRIKLPKLGPFQPYQVIKGQWVGE